jgi:hypothetical protein
LVWHTNWLAAWDHLESWLWQSIVVSVGLNDFFDNGGGHNFLNLFTWLMDGNDNTFLWFASAAEPNEDDEA